MGRNDSGTSITKQVKRLSSLAGAISTVLPGSTYFVHCEPPLFSATALVSSGLALAIFLRVFAAKRNPVLSLRSGFRSILAAILLVSVYGVLLTSLTVSTPAGTKAKKQRFQIGFGMSERSLTEAAKEKKKQFDLKTPEELMLAFGGFEPGGTYLIWQSWSIVSSGGLLIIVFVTAFSLWAYGLAQLAYGLPHAE